jgi:hypothetical protein
MNLSTLEQISSITNIPEVLFYLGTNTSSNVGRPISLLSFAFQHYHFPTAWWFKYVNVMIHLLNGCLLFVFLLLAGKLSGHSGQSAHRIKVVALIATVLWLVHPLHVSTVQYVIQRMTELSAFFTLGGLISYCIGRQYFLHGKTLAGYLWVSSAVICGGTLATLSKENGVLLPVYLLVLELVLFSNLSRPRYWRVWITAFLIAPIVILITYFSININSLVLNTYKTRDFTLLERLMSETRVLSDYLYKTIITLPHSFGIFHDNYAISHGMLDPPQTAISILFISALVASAVYFKKRAPIYSFAILWFFAGHILESTFIPLELYFEHRNYLPIIGVLYALVMYSFKLYDMLSSRTLKVSLATAGVFYLGVLSSVAYAENILWGNVYKQAYVWAAENKDSLRAQLRLGSVLTVTEHYAEAAMVYSEITQHFPKKIIAYTEWLALSCNDKTITPPSLKEIVNKISHSELEVGVIASLNSIVSLKEKNECGAIPHSKLAQILKFLIDNPNYNSKMYYLYFLLGKLHASERLLNPAMLSLDKAFSLNKAPQIPLLQIEWLVSAGLYKDAKIYLEKARQSAKRRPLLDLALNKQFQWWEETIATLESIQYPPKPQGNSKSQTTDD